MTLFLGAVSVISLLNWLIAFLKAGELEGSVQSLQESSDELIEQTSINYKNSLTVNRYLVEPAQQTCLIRLLMITNPRMKYHSRSCIHERLLWRSNF